MKKLIVTALALTFLSACGDSGEKSTTDAPPKIKLESESDRLSYALGVANGASMRKSIDDPASGIADKVNFDKIVKGCDDGFGDKMEITESEMSAASEEFVAKIETGEDISDEVVKNFSYFIGVNVTKKTIGQKEQKESPEILYDELYAAGFKAALLKKKTLISAEDRRELVQNFLNDRQKAIMEKMQAESMKVYP